MTAVQARDDTSAWSRSTPRLVGVAWGLLLVNTLGYSNVSTIVPFPRPVAQVITMGSLVLAFWLALLLNPRIRLRPNAYLALLTVLVMVSVASSLRMDSGYGALFRCFRLAVFVATLWLLTAWWRGDLRFASYQLRGLSLISFSVLLGLIISPGGAFSGPDGRLAGTIWPIPAPQVAQYSAVAAGLAVIMWMVRVLDTRSTVLIAVPGFTLLILAHTRTALFGVVTGLLVCGLWLSVNSSRARHLFGALVAVGSVLAAVFGSVIKLWLTRGQDAEQLSNFTGRAKVWELLLDEPRTFAELVTGVGLTDKSFNGLPIDNAWVSVYHEQGLAGIVLVAGFILALLVAIALRPPTPQRYVALFLVVYCVAASWTEVGLGDASPYLLHLAVATSLLVPAIASSPSPDNPMPSSRTPRCWSGNADRSTSPCGDRGPAGFEAGAEAGCDIARLRPAT